MHPAPTGSTMCIFNCQKTEACLDNFTLSVCCEINKVKISAIGSLENPNRELFGADFMKLHPGLS